jgi:hypothetical protein
MKIYNKIAGLILVGLTAFSPVFAAEFISPSHDDPNTTISSTETHKNLYTVGANVTVNSSTMGDLIVAGSAVNIDGTIEDDVLAAGGTLTLNGSVGGDVRVAGGNVTISAPIAGDLIVGGGNVTISERASIGGDLVVGSGNVTVNAPVRGKVLIGGGNIVLNSRMEGEVNVNAADKLTFGSRADIPGRVSYKAPHEAIFQQGSNVPNKEFTKIDDRKLNRGVKSILTFGFLVKLLAWILAGFLLMKFRGKGVKEVAEDVQQNPGRNLLLGLGVTVLTPILVIALFFTLVGYYIALVGLFGYIVFMLLASLIAALVTGSLALRYLNKPGEPLLNWQVVLLGVVLWTLLKFIPIVGWVVIGLIFIATAGSIARKLADNFTNK